MREAILRSKPSAQIRGGTIYIYVIWLVGWFLVTSQNRLTFTFLQFFMLDLHETANMYNYIIKEKVNRRTAPSKCE